MNIDTPDPFISIYAFEKHKNPEKKLWWVQVSKKDLEDVDRLVELSHGHRDVVSTQKDWTVVEELLKFYSARWPVEFDEFKKTIPQIKATRRKGGYSVSKEIKYVASFPPRFERLIKSVFPLQQFNKDFIYKFIRKFTLFKVGGAI